MKTHYLKKPKKCPKCSSLKIAEILWGMPNMDEELEQALKNGDMIIGGCCITGHDPQWQCIDCETNLYIKERGYLEYQRRPRKCPACLSVNITTEITEQVNLNYELIKEIEKKLEGDENRFSYMDEENYNLRKRISKLYRACDTLPIRSHNTQANDIAERHGWNCKVCNLPTYKITD